MEIVAFLAVLASVILLAWGLGFFRPSALKQKSRIKNKLQSHLPPKSPELQAQDTTTSRSSLPKAKSQDNTTSISSSRITPRQSPVFKKLQTLTTRNKHQLNIQHGDQVLQQLRSKATQAKLPMVLGILRRINP